MATSSSESLAWRWWPTSLLLGVLTVAADRSPVDRWVADYFFDAHAGVFPDRHAFWAEHILHRGGIWLVAAVAVTALLCFAASWLRPFPRLARWRRPAAYIFACVALSTGSVALIKQATNVDCPWDMSQYGGDADRPYTHVFAVRPVGMPHGHCFPGAHSSGAFSLLAFGVLLHRLRHRHARTVLALGFAMGFAYAATQWTRGAHIPSHDLASAWVAWAVACLLVRWVPAPRTPSPA